MLKTLRGLFLGLVVLVSSACVTPTHASSADIIITQVQAGSPQSAKHEIVSLFNNSQHEVDMTGWCLTNKANIAFVCITPEIPDRKLVLLPSGSTSIVSKEYDEYTRRPTGHYGAVYPSASSSSGSIVNSSDTISVINRSGEAVASYSWSATIPSGKAWLRTVISTSPEVYAVTGLGSDWRLGTIDIIYPSQLYNFIVETPPPVVVPDPIPVIDIPDTTVPIVPTVPTTPTLPTTPTTPTLPTVPGITAEPEVVYTHPFITEILPDATGSDTGNEFIELFNPTTQTIDLAEYGLKVGQNLEKLYAFPAGATIAPYSYRLFTNAEIRFSLLNTASKVQLMHNGEQIGETVTYSSPKSGHSWALVDGVWQYVDIPTPDAENVQNNESDEEASTVKTATATTAKPCQAGYYRHPDTNRCRLLATNSTTASAACKVGQVRNPETNRCRNLATTTTPAPCKEGQERNPETNRCRNVTVMTNATHGVKGVSTQASGSNWYLWLVIGGVVALLVGYGVYEWRVELKQLGYKVQQRLIRRRG